MRRLIPLVIVIMLAAVMAVVYVPEFLKARQFKQTCNAMLADVRAGNWVKLPNYADPSDAQALARLTQLASPSLSDGIESLVLNSYDKPDSDTIWAQVTLKYDGHGANLIYRGKLRWRYENGTWIWDMPASLYAPYSGFAESEWRALGELAAAAEGY